MTDDLHGRRSGGRAGAPGRPGARRGRAGAVPHPDPRAVRGPGRGGPRADRAQRRHDPPGGWPGVPRRRRGARTLRDAGADVDGERVRFPRGMCRSIVQASAPAAYVQHARNPAHSVADRRPEHGLRAQLRVAVRARPRRRAPLRDARGLPELRQARLPARRTSTTPAGRSASRWTCRSTSGTSTWSTATCGSPTSRSWARSRPPSGRATRWRWRGSCSARTFVDQHAVVTSLINANSPLVWDATMLGRRPGLRGGQPGDDHHAVHPRRGDGAGDRRGRGRPDAGRGARRHGVHPARPARRARGPGLVRELHVDAVRRPHVRHAGARARPVRDGGAGAPAGRPVPLRRQPDAPARSRTPRRPTSPPRRSSPPSSRARTSCSTRPAGSRAA